MKIRVLVSFCLLYFSFFAAAEPISDSIAEQQSKLGGYIAQEDLKAPTLAATNMAMRAFRYLETERDETKGQENFLLSCYHPELAAFAEHSSDSPTVLANAHALMLMAELGMPEDVHAVSARDYLVEHAETADEIYMAMAGLQVMGLENEIPASWMKTMMDLAISEDATVTAYQKARAIITCMRTGFNLPDYTRFLDPLQAALTEVTKDPEFHRSKTSLQEAYTLARALVMIDGRVDLVLPEMNSLAKSELSIGHIYKLAALHAWAPRLKGQLKVVICTGFAPVGYRDEAGRIAGMDADLMRAFAEEEGYDLVFVEQTRFQDIWALPSRGHFDAAVSGLSKRKGRLCPGIRWSYPYFNVERSLSILKSNADRLQSIADFDGLKIAVTSGTTGAQDVADRIPNAIQVPYDNEEAAIKDLLAGKVHALARGDVSNRYDARIHPELAVIDAHPMVPVEEFVVAVSSERVALGQKLDRFLREKRRTGELNKLFADYLGTAALSPFPKAHPEASPSLTNPE